MNCDRRSLRGSGRLGCVEKDIYHWRVQAERDVMALCWALWPWMGTRRRGQIVACQTVWQATSAYVGVCPSTATAPNTEPSRLAPLGPSNDRCPSQYVAKLYASPQGSAYRSSPDRPLLQSPLPASRHPRPSFGG